MNIPYVFKKCTKCGRWLVANSVNFHKHKVDKYGLRSCCKGCRKVQRKKYYEANKDKELAQRKEYYNQNKDKYKELNKKWRTANKDKELARYKKYYEQNKDKELARYKKYRNTPRGQVVEFNKRTKRRSKEQELGNGITTEQWLDMMQYFNWRCAYSGKSVSKQGERSIDHIVPLNSNGEHEIWNLVPMVKSLNSSKQDKDMLSWYQEQDCYSEERLAKIREWQEYAYNKYYIKEGLYDRERL